MTQLEINGLFAEYSPSLPILEDVSLKIETGEIISIIGPSGSGKSTILRVLVGLLHPSQGHVIVNGTEVNYKSPSALKSMRDTMAMVFQQFNLFQNMSVLRNVMIAPLKIKKEPEAEVEARAKEYLEIMGLGEKFDAYPDQLSGGQQQRVALARALALRPKILLLDEVTSALDPEMVNEVLDAIRVLSTKGITLIIVSHEMAFVREVSDRVIMMDDGKVVEIGTPDEIFTAAKTQRCRDFISNIIQH
ncbi:MAG TPA: amino acid ABC transporter ATP-binding protein [Rhodospirillales bacterium]|jgi:polar amino acid transport system ATP-binding protein|nr:amino acid ABC transporter ATP-binding protein [Rhodospirillales bacterium]HIL75022.1 amino acid ABC transporter ATP-binding protein [Rhodospirillales bacterium]